MFKRIVIVALSGWLAILPRAVLAQDAQPKSAFTKEDVLTDAAIIATLIALSIAAYRKGGPGPCACPEDTDRAGRSCGKRSAHSRPGGWTVHCYASDITADMIRAYRATQATVKLK